MIQSPAITSWWLLVGRGGQEQLVKRRRNSPVMNKFQLESQANCFVFSGQRRISNAGFYFRKIGNSWTPRIVADCSSFNGIEEVHAIPAAPVYGTCAGI